MHTHRTSGFSMVELLTTLVVLAVLLGLVVARYNEVQNDATIVAGEQSAKNLTSAYNNWEAAGGVAGDQVATSDILRILKEDTSMAISRSNRARSIADGGNSSAVRASIPDEIALPSPDEPPLEEVQADGYKLKFDNEKKEFVSTPTLGFGGGSTGSSSTGGSTTGGNTTPPPSGGNNGGDNTEDPSDNEEPPPDDFSNILPPPPPEHNKLVVKTDGPRGFTYIAYDGYVYFDSKQTLPPNDQAKSLVKLRNVDQTGELVQIWTEGNNTSQATWDADTKTYVVTDAYTRRTWRLGQTAFGVSWNVTIENNTTDKEIIYAELYPISLNPQVPGDITYAPTNIARGTAGVQVLRMNHPTNNSAIIINNTPLVVCFTEWAAAGAQPTRPGWHTPSVTWDSSLAATGDIESRHLPIGPGQSINLAFEIRFTDQSTPTKEIAADASATYGILNPQKIVHKDRRPIASYFCHSGSSSPSAFFPKNNTPQEFQIYQEEFMRVADQIIDVTLDANGQAVILWDIEGRDQYINGYAYVGDPQMIPITNPAFDQISDAFFQKFKDAGLRVGLTIRNSETILKQDGNWGINPEYLGDRTVEVIAAKVRYAYDRWGLDIFYVDSVSIEDHRYFIQVAKMFPNILFLPEGSHGMGVDYWAHTAPYLDARYGEVGTPPHVYDVYPNAFSVTAIGDTDLVKYRDQIIASIRRGDILLTRVGVMLQAAELMTAAGVNPILP